MEKFITVSDLNNYINRMLNSDEFLRDLWIKGEISGFKWYRKSGHMYFTLKDEESSISCVMFKSRNRYLKFGPEDGMEVLLRGYVSVFAPQGKYQLYVEEIQPYGVGGLFLYLEKLKEKLSAKGYFALENKQAIPGMVNRVGIVTSQDGAALRDILRVLKQRHSNVEVVLANSSVQGVNAPRELAEAVRLLNEHGYVEVIIIGRGGGSFEDLMAFNSEEVVKAIYDSKIPVISAVGHEVDFSLSDMAADLRAATPTQAAQMAVPDLASLKKDIANCQQCLIRAMNRKISYDNELLDRIMMNKVWKEPGAIVERRQEILHDLEKTMKKIMLTILKEKSGQFSVALAALDSLSPVKTIQRGYAVLRKGDKIIRSVDDVSTGERLQITVQNGDLDVEVKTKEKVERWNT